jgi:PAS domain S-box-containing protein
MDHAPVAVVAVDSDGYYVYENELAERLLGYDPETLYDMHITDVVEAEAGWLAAQFENLKRHEVWSGCISMHRQGGGHVSVAVNCFADTSAGDTFYVGLLNPGVLSRRSAHSSESVPNLLGFGLTPHEFRLLQLIAEGFGEEEAALLLHTGLDDVRTLTRRVLEKTNSPSRTEACLRAIKAGLIR